MIHYSSLLQENQSEYLEQNALRNTESEVEIYGVEVNEEDIKNILMKVKNSKKPRPGNIKMELLKYW